ncbi:hypothetical protein ACZ90_31065 [Streptomyces albus subsp. albus]|nr:hypothetical protein ACZ90_31065 [Streptomyces albus subsp. albus]
MTERAPRYGALPPGTRAASLGPPGYSATLACEAASARQARLLVRGALRIWGLDGLTAPATLVVSELVANSVEHTRSHAIRVTVSRPWPALVRVAVTDTSRIVPELREADDEDEEGRGLAVIDTISARWGYDRLPWGKRTWAELRMPVGEKE